MQFLRFNNYQHVIPALLEQQFWVNQDTNRCRYRFFIYATKEEVVVEVDLNANTTSLDYIVE